MCTSITPFRSSDYEERFRTSFSRDRLEQFTRDEASTIAASLRRLIPQEEGVDLVGFRDWATGRPLGRGDRPIGMPPELELFRQGLLGLHQTSQARHGRRFTELSDDQQDDVLRSARSIGTLPASPTAPIRLPWAGSTRDAGSADPPSTSRRPSCVCTRRISSSVALILRHFRRGSFARSPSLCHVDTEDH